MPSQTVLITGEQGTGWLQKLARQIVLQELCLRSARAVGEDLYPLRSRCEMPVPLSCSRPKSMAFFIA
jgi:hypothetical protein